jgi:hypothetical protein
MNEEVKRRIIDEIDQAVRDQDWEKIGMHIPSKGVGDTIAKMTKAIGIKPCGGCKKRQEWLNKKFPYKNSLDSEDMDE